MEALVLLEELQDGMEQRPVSSIRVSLGDAVSMLGRFVTEFT